MEQAELKRMQQRQLKEYSPELHSLARLQTYMAETLARNDLSTEQKLHILNSYQSRFDKLQRDTGVLSSGSLSSAGPPNATPQPSIKASDDGALSGAAPNLNTSLKQDLKDAKSHTLTPALKMVRELHVEPQYELKARNQMIKILDNPDVIKRNGQGELVINGVADPNTDFNALFSSMVGRVHDLKQPGIDKFLGALRQIGVKRNELSGQSLQRMYSSTPAHVRVTERPPRPKKHQPEFCYEDPGESDIELEYAYSHLHHIKATPPKFKKKDKKSSKQQTGFGLRHNSIVPPGQKPKILFVY